MWLLTLTSAAIWPAWGISLLLSKYGWSPSIFDDRQVQILLLLWMVLGCALYWGAIKLYRLLPLDLQEVVAEALRKLDNHPGSSRTQREEKPEDSLFTVKNAVLYHVIDPFGEQERKFQEKQRQEWEHTQKLHE